MTTRFRIALALLCTLCVTGCATQRTVVPSAVVTSQQSKAIPAARVKDAVVIGQSTRAHVIAALGEPLVIRFDNGFEVWVYRLADDTRGSAAAARRMAVSGPVRPGPGTSAEFVILFAPSGVVAKTRVRPAPEPSRAG